MCMCCRRCSRGTGTQITKTTFYLSNGEYNNVESESKTTYVLLTKQPSDWAANYKDYFEVKENEYAAVDSVTVEIYKKQTKTAKRLE